MKRAVLLLFFVGNALAADEPKDLALLVCTNQRNDQANKVIELTVALAQAQKRLQELEAKAEKK